MNRLVKAGGKVQVDDDAVDKLKVTPDDFEYALENDVKPVGIWKIHLKISFVCFRHLATVTRNWNDYFPEGFVFGEIR